MPRLSLIPRESFPRLALPHCMFSGYHKWSFAIFLYNNLNKDSYYTGSSMRAETMYVLILGYIPFACVCVCVLPLVTGTQCHLILSYGRWIIVCKHRSNKHWTRSSGLLHTIPGLQLTCMFSFKLSSSVLLPKMERNLPYLPQKVLWTSNEKCEDILKSVKCYSNTELH